MSTCPTLFPAKGLDWTRPARLRPVERTAQERLANVIGAVILVSVIALAGLLARRNLRLGRGDRKGALRLAAFALSATMIEWALSAHHLATFGGACLVTLVLGALGVRAFWIHEREFADLV